MAGNVYLVSDFNPDMRIRQYMRLDYFLSLLASKKYYVRSKFDFEDEREYRLPLKQMLPIHLALKEIDNETSERENARMTAKIKAHWEDRYIHTSCWSKQTHENILMWQAYASKLGVCVCSTVRNFCTALNLNSYDILCGDIAYEGYNFYQDDTRFNKSKEFDGEQEFRFYFLSGKEEEGYRDCEELQKPFEIPVNITEMIDKVIISPYISGKASVELCNILHERYGLKAEASKIKLK